MKSFVLAALLASASAIKPNQHVDLQIGVEAKARANTRVHLQNELRHALGRGDAYPETILPGSEPIMPIPSDPIDL